MHELLTACSGWSKQQLVQCACTDESSTKLWPTLLWHRQHFSLQAKSSCLNSLCNSDILALLERWIYHQTMTKNRPCLLLCSRHSGLLSRPLEMCGALHCSLKNVSIWPPSFVHTALQFWPVTSLLNGFCIIIVFHLVAYQVWNTANTDYIIHYQIIQASWSG